MKVSILIPTYNRPEYLTEAIDSAMAQDYPDKEIIVVDDGSDIPVKCDYSIVKVIRQENKGCPGALNTGIKNATGELITILNDDDLFYRNDSISKRVEWFEKIKGLESLYSGTICIDEEGKPIDKYIFEYTTALKLWQIGDQFFSAISLMWKRSIHDRIGYFGEAYLNNEDYDWKLRLMFETVCIGIDFPVVFYRIHPGNVNKQEGHYEKQKLYERLFKTELRRKYISILEK